MLSINHVDNLNINDPVSKTSCSINTIADDSLPSDIKCLEIISQVLPEYVNLKKKLIRVLHSITAMLEAWLCQIITTIHHAKDKSSI